jgi:hypothetical protein
MPSCAQGANPFNQLGVDLPRRSRQPVPVTAGARETRAFDRLEPLEEAFAMRRPARPREQLGRDGKHEFAAARWATILVVRLRRFEAEAFAYGACGEQLTISAIAEPL